MKEQDVPDWISRTQKMSVPPENSPDRAAWCPLSAEEEAEILLHEDIARKFLTWPACEAEYDRSRLLAALDRERQEKERLAAGHELHLSKIAELRADNERLAAQVEVMQRAIEAGKALDSAWIALIGNQEPTRWQRQKQASKAFWELIVELEYPQFGQAVGVEPTEYPKEDTDGA